MVRRLERPEGALLIGGLPAVLRIGMELDWLGELASGGELGSRVEGLEGLGDKVAGGCDRLPPMDNMVVGVVGVF